MRHIEDRRITATIGATAFVGRQTENETDQKLKEGNSVHDVCALILSMLVYNLLLFMSAG